MIEIELLDKTKELDKQVITYKWFVHVEGERISCNNIYRYHTSLESDAADEVLKANISKGWKVVSIDEKSFKPLNGMIRKEGGRLIRKGVGVLHRETHILNMVLCFTETETKGGLNGQR